MNKFFNFKGAKKSDCPVCGTELIDDFCNICNKYISPEIAHKRLKEKYPNTKCVKCKSKKVEFRTEKQKAPIPKNILDKTVLNFIEKYNEKYPQDIPPYREVAKCKKCEYEWYVDGYRNDNKTMVSIRNILLIGMAFLFFALVITIGSIFENNQNDFEQINEQTVLNSSYIDGENDIEETIENIITTENQTTEVTTEYITEESITGNIITNTRKSGRIVYVTPYGEKYHCSASCAGSNAMERDYDDIEGVYEPCKKCAY